METARPRLVATAIHPDSCGVSLALERGRAPVEPGSTIDFFEVHAESCMGMGGPRHRLLERIAAERPVTLHSTGLSIAAHQPADRDFLMSVQRLIDRCRPWSISAPLAWSSYDGAYLNAELPIPYNDESLTCICRNVDEAQQAFGMQVLLKNPAAYLLLETSTLSEAAFLRMVVERTGCGLVLDLTNIYVSAINLGCEPMDWVDSFPIEDVQQMHLAGISEGSGDEGGRLLVGDPAAPVPESVWVIYRRILGRTGPLPTVIERHGAALAVETAIAKQALRRASRQPASHHPLQAGISP
jgi:uncharacterized protein (UPF0276 family)